MWVIDSDLSEQVEESLSHLSAALHAGDGELAARSARAAYLID
jgi:hypothetical protein